MPPFTAILKPDNPITCLTLRRLRAGFGKHAVGWGLLISLIGVIVLIGLPMSLLPPSHVLPQFKWEFVYAPWQFGLIAWQEVVKQAISIGGGILLAIAANNILHEGSTDLLRTTPYSARQIRLAMLGAVLRYLLVPLILVTLVRGGLVLFVASNPSLYQSLLTPTAIIKLGMNNVPPIIQQTAGRLCILEYDLWEIWVRQVAAVGFLKGWPLWEAYTIIQPVWDTLLYGLIGLAAVSRTHREDNRLLAASGWIGGVWIAGFLGERLLVAGRMWLRYSWAELRWFPGIPALGYDYIWVPGLFGPSMAIVIGVKILVMGFLLRAVGKS
ncbi:MAG: hypothetical protein JXJ17_16985 [Anaerolineae bacterium]|nr:hypothetical protein [Anaerolineae bacterium]